MEKKYLSEYEVMLATLKELGGDVNKKYASLFDVELAILKAVQEGGGGGGGGLTPGQVRNIVESYNYTTMQAVENKQFMKQKKLTLNGDEPLQILDEDGNVLSYNDVKALVDNKALFVYMLVDNAFYIPCGDMVIPSGHNAVEFSSAFIVNGTANIARIIIDTADEVLYEQYILVDTDTLSGYATKQELTDGITEAENYADTNFVPYSQMEDYLEPYIKRDDAYNAFAEKDELTWLASKQEVADGVLEAENYADDNFLTRADATENYALKTDIPSVDDFATEEYVNEEIEGVRSDIPSLDGYATEQWVEDKNYATKDEIPSVEGLASTDYVDEQIQDTRNLIPSVEGLASETFVTEEIENNNETIAATYATKEEVAGGGMQMEVVDSLPETGVSKTIYLVPAKTATELNVKDEYVWVDGKWEVIGSTKINLEDYATIEYVDTIAGEIRAEIPEVGEFVTAPFVQSEIEYNNEEIIAATYATKDEIPSVDGLASEQWVEDKGYTTMEAVEAKGYLTEHQSLKTINGESIVGEGDIEIQGGSGVTEEKVEELIGAHDFATQSQLSAYLPLSGGTMTGHLHIGSETDTNDPQFYIERNIGDNTYKSFTHIPYSDPCITSEYSVNKTDKIYMSLRTDGLYVGKNSGKINDNKVVVASELENYAEKSSVMQRYGGGISYFWSGTQSQYDALGEYHDDTLYIIKD